MRRGGPGKDDRLAGRNLAAAVDDPHMIDGKARAAAFGDVRQGLERQLRVMLEHEPVHLLAVFGCAGAQRRRS